MTRYPECPHCEYELDEEEMWYGEYSCGKVHIGECDTSEIKCPSCEKTYHVMCEHHYTFKHVDEDGEDL